MLVRWSVKRLYLGGLWLWWKMWLRLWLNNMNGLALL